MADQEVIVREWLWYIYPVVILFSGVAIAFGIWSFRCVKAAKILLIAAPTKGYAARSMLFFVVFTVTLRLLIFLASIFVVWMLIDDSLTGFIRLERTPTMLRLHYHSSLADSELPLGSILKAEVFPKGNKGTQFVITTKDGRHFKSVSTDAEAIWDFQHVMKDFTDRR